MTKEEYFTGSNLSNYYVTTAYLQDTSETILRDLVDRIQEEFRKRGDQMAAKKKVDVSKSLNRIIDDYTKEINTDRPIKRGTELVSVGRLETQDEYLLDILKENGFYLMYQKRETKFGDCEYYQVLYPVI